MFREMRKSEIQLSSTETIKALNEGNYGVLFTFGADGYPYGVPVHYVYHNGSIYFHCAVIGHKLDNINNNPNVSFCVIGSDRVISTSFTTRYRNVRGV
jgi:hypothetical protein